MGLLIIAYNQCSPLSDFSAEEQADLIQSGAFLTVQNPPPFADRIAPLQAGRYWAQEARRENIGDYTYYVQWRDWLSNSFNDAFEEMISFSDSNAFLGPFAVRNLASDFTSRLDVLDEVLDRTVTDAETRDSYGGTFTQFENCFREAGADGLVQFS